MEQRDPTAGSGVRSQDEASAKPVSAGDVVAVHYEGKLEDGTVFDSSQGRDPIRFQAGQGNVIAGFERAVVGMTVGEKKSVTVPPEEGYGPWRQELLTKVDRQVAGADQVQPGMLVQVQTPQQEVLQARVAEVTEEEVTLDFNHPLAGKVLQFDIQVVDLEPPGAPPG